MSSRRVRYFRKEVKIANTTFATGTITVNTVGSHNLATGDSVSILMKNSTTQVDIIATVVTTTQFTFPSVYDLGIQGDGIIIVPFFRSLDTTGGMPSLTTGNSSHHSPVISSWITGASNTCTYNIEGSIDNIHWATLTTGVAHAALTTVNTTISVYMPYLRINITSAILNTAGTLTVGLVS